MLTDRKKAVLSALCAIGVVIATITSVGSWNGWLDRYDDKLVDQQFRIRKKINDWLKLTPKEGAVVLVGIDNQSVNPDFSKRADRWGAGKWLTRENWVDAASYMARSFKPKVVAYDIIFQPYQSSSDQNGNASEVDQQLQNGFKEGRGTFEILRSKGFPREKIYYFLDDDGNGRMANVFFNLEDDRAQNPDLPKFITAYSLTSKDRENASPWNEKSEEDSIRMDRIKSIALPSAWISNHEKFKFQDNVAFPFLSLAQSPIGLGFINVPRDPDGIIRWVPLVDGILDPRKDSETKQSPPFPRFVPSIALQACMIYLGISWDPAHPPTDRSTTSGVTVDFGNEIHLWTPKRDIHIPIDSQGRMFLNFERNINPDFPNTPYISIVECGEDLEKEKQGKLIAKDREERLKNAEEVRSRLKDKIIFIGTTFTGGGDVGPCALDSNVPFVFIHMTAADNILRQNFLSPLASRSKIGNVLVIWVLIGAMVALAYYNKPAVALRGNAILITGSILVGMLLFYFNVIILPMGTTGLSMLITFATISFYRYIKEQKRGLDVRKKFSTMVSGKVLSYMEQNPESFTLSGERREATMFFSDVAGFTTISEKLSPEELGQILNDYLTPMTEIIQGRDGYLDKYSGDGIMAVWGVPFPEPRHAIQACQGALDQQAKIKELQVVFRDQYKIELEVRMGLNSGIVSAGNMGSKNRFSYTVMGDAVNFAARLEPVNKDYGTNIMIGEKTQELVREEFVTRLMDKIVVKGKTDPKMIYELVGKKGEVSADILEGIAQFEKGLSFYWGREWTKALECFESVLKKMPDDTPSQTFIERVKDFQKDPPPADWSGAYVREKKD